MMLWPILMNTHFTHHAWYKIRGNYPRYVLENDLARAQQTHLYEIV